MKYISTLSGKLGVVRNYVISCFKIYFETARLDPCIGSLLIPTPLTVRSVFIQCGGLRQAATLYGVQSAPFKQAVTHSKMSSLRIIKILVDRKQGTYFGFFAVFELLLILDKWCLNLWLKAERQEKWFFHRSVGCAYIEGFSHLISLFYHATHYVCCLVNTLIWYGD